MKDLHIVAHTHWDREWYKPFQFFRVKLVYMIDNLISMLEDNEDFTSFMLDGQAIVLEDYLRIRPEQEKRLKALTESGRIITGPWYIQPDEFAPDAESLIRNLLAGIKISKEFGRPMSVGYLPDSFGHSAQMPQILRGFGIDSAVVMRGVDFEKIQSTEFSWKGLNGDEVLGIYLLKGYMNAMFLSGNDTVNAVRLRKLESELAGSTCSDSILVMNGVDHAFAQRQAASFCSRKSGRRLGSLEGYISSLQQMSARPPVLEGELITPVHHRVHTSIASTRINQKAENRRLSILIARVLEPLCTITALQGAEYPQGLISEAWKLLISNQTHDGICGCCTDEVHREMDQRFTEVGQIAETLIKNHSRAFSYMLDSKGFGITVFNTAMSAGVKLVEAELIVDGPFILEDENGTAVKLQIVSVEDADISKNSIWTLYLGTPQPAKKVRIIFPCDFSSVLEYRYYRISPVKAGLKDLRVSVPEKGGNSFENDFYRMEIADDGSLSVVDKDSGLLYEGLNTYEDTGEGGDAYNHSPLENDSPVFSRGAAASMDIIEDGPLRKTFRIVQVMMIPESLNDEADSRSSRMTEMEIITRVSVYPGNRRIDFTVDVDNRAKSHRIRALFPFGAPAEVSFAETQFGVIERSTEPPAAGEGWPEIPLPIYSMQRFAGLRTGGASMTVLNRGLTEYEVYNPKDAVLALTLHRGVSMMGRSNLAIRPGRPSGVEMPTPDAESIGLLHREYSLLFGGEVDNSEIVREADSYTVPGLAVQNRLKLDRIEKANRDFFKFLSVDNLRSIIGESFSKAVMPGAGLIELGSSRLSVSTIKKAEADNSIIVRMFNPGPSAVKDETLRLNISYSAVSVTNLLEQEIGRLAPASGLLKLPGVEPYTQITLKIAREDDE